MKKGNLLLDAGIVGLALFATIFGAGNLVFPPILGLTAGTDWVPATLGLLLSGIVLPVLGTWAVNCVGDHAKFLTYHVSPNFYTILTCCSVLLVCVGSTLPRVGATTHEVGVQSIFPNCPIWVTVTIFFAVTYYFARERESVIDKVGKYLTPALVVIIGIILVKGIITPIGEIADPVLAKPFVSSILEGYKVGDLTTTLMLAHVFIYALEEKGYIGADLKKGVFMAGIVCIVVMSAIYVALTYIGATGGSLYPADISRTALISGIALNIFGKTGQVGLGIVVALACLTTSVTLAASAAAFFVDLCRTKFGVQISYKWLIRGICVFCAVAGTFGVTNIINYVTPIFLTIYPPLIVLTVLGFVDKWIPNDGIYKGAVYTSTFFGFLDGVIAVFPNFTGLYDVLSYIPLFTDGFGWVIPSLAMGVIMGIVYRGKPRNYCPKTEDRLAL